MAERLVVPAFRAAYADAFARYLHAPDETGLSTAYELGRDAVERDLSVLELALVHHQVLAAALAQSGSDAWPITEAAGRFFAESLSSFEMLRRAFGDARDAARAERHQAVLLRRLSSFLADASVAAGRSGPYDELLQLVAEQALELVDADYCLATASFEGARHVVAFAAGKAEAGAVPTWVTAAAQETPSHPFRRASPDDDTEARVVDRPHSVLAVPLMGLDGAVFGALQLFDRRTGEFTDTDEAVVVHLADLAAAALDRARMYAESPRRARDG